MTQQFNETYEEMVKNLFKPMPTPVEELLHAAVGLSGEVGELVDACNRKNILEECGDLEFYLEALVQNIRPFERVPLGWQFNVVPFGRVFHDLTVCSSTMLDLAKKSWAYNKPVATSPLSMEAQNFRNLLDTFYQYLGTTKAEVRHLNQSKLNARYPNGYTNEAAIARADKA